MFRFLPFSKIYCVRCSTAAVLIFVNNQPWRPFPWKMAQYLLYLFKTWSVGYLNFVQKTDEYLWRNQDDNTPLSSTGGKIRSVLLTDTAPFLISLKLQALLLHSSKETLVTQRNKILYILNPEEKVIIQSKYFKYFLS